MLVPLWSSDFCVAGGGLAWGLHALFFVMTRRVLTDCHGSECPLSVFVCHISGLSSCASQISKKAL